MDFQRITGAARQCLRSAGRTTAAITRDCGQFVYRHRETILGGLGGYIVGRAVESIPVVGRLLKPVASLVLGLCGTACGYQKELERRRIETREKGCTS
jgi:hypothetical protein